MPLEPANNPTAERIAELYRAQSGRVLATLIRLLGDFDQAEEALQEAFRAALETWPRDGIPQNPRAWLVSTGRFKGIDSMRRQQRGREVAQEAVGDTVASYPDWEGDVIEDDQLRLIFTCCHPDIPLDARIALALREICGLTAHEIASAFLISHEAMKKRLSRAKASIREQEIPYEIPSSSEMAARLDAVLHVIYLVYNEGYAASSGQRLVRQDLTDEAVYLARLVVDLMPEPEAIGLLALILLHESRRGARVDKAGEPIPLEHQDRSLWVRELIDEAVELLRRAVMSGRVGSYTLQALIVSVHSAAPSVADTDWELIVRYYDALLRLRDSPVVALQRAIALGMRDGPETGLALIDQLVDRRELTGYHQIHSARAQFAMRVGELDTASESFRAAIALAADGPERRYLQRQLENISR